MNKNLEYRKYIVEKSTPTVVSRDIISLGMPKLGYVQIFSQSPQILVNDLKVFEPVKSSSSCNLGPGRYPTPPPMPGPSCTFGYSKRFVGVDISSVQTNRSTDKIKENKNLQQFSLLNKSATERERFKIRHSKELITKQAKAIIDIEKKVKIATRIKEKLHRIDVRRHKTERNSITQSMATLMIFTMIPILIFKRFSNVKNYKRRINKFKLLLLYFSKAIGKFKLVKKRTHLENSWKILRKRMPPIIRDKKSKIQDMFYERVLSVTNSFLKSDSIPKLNHLIRKRILLIQKSVRGFIMISRCRKLFINLIWDKHDKNKKKIPPNVKGFYIWQYIYVHLKEISSMKRNGSKIKFFFTVPCHEDIIANALNSIKENKSSVLKLYAKEKVKDLIRNTYSLKKAWDINISDHFIIPEHSINLEPKSIIKRKFIHHIKIHKKKLKFNIHSPEIIGKPKKKSIKVKAISPCPINQ